MAFQAALVALHLFVLNSAAAAPGQRVPVAMPTEIETRKSWFTWTPGYCPPSQLNRPSIAAIGQALCPGDTPTAPVYLRWEQTTEDPYFGRIFCADPVSQSVINKGALLTGSCAYGEQCEVPLIGFQRAGGSLSNYYCEKRTTNCPENYSPDGQGQCFPTSNPNSDKAKCEGKGCNGLGNPIELYFGNKYQIERDYAGSGTFPLEFVRYYNNPNTTFSLTPKLRRTFNLLCGPS